MDKKLQELNAKLAGLVDESKAITALAKKEDRDVTDEEAQTQIDLAEEVSGVKAEIETLKKRIEALNEARAQVKEADELLNQPQPRKAQPASGDIKPPATDTGDPVQAWSIPASARRYQTKNITGKDADKRAYAFGMFALAAMGNRNAEKWCSQHGLAPIEAAGHTTTDLGAGSVFVPDQFDNELLILREQYGVFRQRARVRPMTGNTLSYNRRTGGLTAYFVGEQQAGTTSETTTDQVSLTARDLYCFATMTNQLAEDAVISIGDDLAREIAYAFALKEDNCGFNGDGTSTYGGITGVREKLKGLSGTIANIAGLTVASGNAYSEITLTDFNSVCGKLPEYAAMAQDCAWYMHKTFWSEVVERLLDAAGGNTNNNLIDGNRPMFKGYPVITSQVMPRTEANSQVCCLFGSLRLAADFGDRRGLELAFSQDATVDSRNMFMTNETAIRGCERFDINVHDVGNASATAASRVAGPIVGLITAAS